MNFVTMMAVLALGVRLLAGGADVMLYAALQQKPTVARFGEWQLRQHAKFAPMPEYPREVVSQKVSGVVVASARFGVDGRAESVEILEAPNAHLADAVRSAVNRWTVPVREGPTTIRGKLTFYFQFRSGKGRVLDPDQMPGGTPRPTPAPPIRTSPAGLPYLEAPRREPEPIPGSHGENLETITVAALKQRAGTEHVVLDPGERAAFQRGHWPGARNIPMDELAVRGGPELPRDKLIVVDCTRETIELCRLAGGRLVERHFPNVVLLVR